MNEAERLRDSDAHMKSLKKAKKKLLAKGINVDAMAERRQKRRAA